MGDVEALRKQLNNIASKYEGLLFTPENMAALQQEVEQVVKDQANELFFLNDKYNILHDVEIAHFADGKVKLLIQWNPQLHHQNYKEVKNFINNTVGLNEKTFMNLVQMEIGKLFKKMDESGELSEIFEKEVQKYLGSYKSGLPRGYTPQSYRLKEIVTQYIAEIVANSFEFNIKPKDDKDAK